MHLCTFMSKVSYQLLLPPCPLWSLLSNIFQKLLIDSRVTSFKEYRNSSYLNVRPAGIILFSGPIQTIYISIWWDIYEKLIETIDTTNFYLEFKVNNENYMATHAIYFLFVSANSRAELGRTADDCHWSFYL